MTWAWLATFPSTNGRIFVTLFMSAATAGKVIATGWSPPWEWLTYLAANLGLDIMQFKVKRDTHTGAGAPPEEK